MRHEPPIYFDIFGRGGRPGNPKPPVVEPPPARGLRMHVVVRNAAGVIEAATIAGEMGRPTWHVDAVPIAYYMLEFIAPVGVQYGDLVSLRITATPGYQPLDLEVPLVADMNVTLQPERPPARVGLVNLDRYSWRDGSGPFFPLGTTLFWALGGWQRGEKDRVKRNLAFIKQHDFDYFRMLAQVDWPGESIDPNWPNYRELLAELLDTAYDQFGLRAQITVTGGGDNPLATASQIVEVVSPRQQTVLMTEAVNEGNASQEDAVRMARLLSGLGLPFGVGLGNQGIDAIEQRSVESGSTVAYFHQERSSADNGARNVRQCWDFKAFARARVNNEPPGPASSVATEDRPDRLAAMRTASIVCGAGAFCLHTGSGVFGRLMSGSYGTRQANLWEIPNIDPMMTAVRAADQHLPSGIENWPKFNTNHPVEIAGGTVNKLYGAIGGLSFAEVAIGCETPVTFRATRPCRVTFASPLGPVVAEKTFSAGEHLALSGHWTYLLTGELR